MQVIVEDDHGEHHLVSHDGFHQLLLEGLPISPYSCREERNLQKAKHEIDMRTTKTKKTKTKKTKTRMTLAPPSTSLALVSSSSPRLGIRPPQQWLLLNTRQLASELQ